MPVLAKGATSPGSALTAQDTADIRAGLGLGTAAVAAAGDFAAAGAHTALAQELDFQDLATLLENQLL